MTVSRTALNYSDVSTQLAAQDSDNLRIFARLIACGIMGFSLLTTCGVMLAMQLDHHQQMQQLRAENERLLILDSKCLEVK